MAKMMGFSDFGSKPKKRKIEYKREAHVPSGQSGSGSNTMPLGRRRENKAQHLDGEAKDDGEQEAEIGVSGHGGGQGDFDGLEREPLGQAKDVKNANVEKSNEVSKSLQLKSSPPTSQPHHEQDESGSFRARTGARGYFHPSFIEDPWKDLR